jgi:tryptophan-rich sensory protein
VSAVAGVRRRFAPVAVAALVVLVVALLGIAATDLGPWYQGLAKPWWQPPDWLFGPAWTLIYGCTAYAGLLAWHHAAGNARVRGWIFSLFALNVLLNIGWSELFFIFRRPDWALIEVGLLWLSIVALIVVVGRVSQRAGWLLVPYLVWVSLAAALNFEVVRLNPSFAGS